MKILTASRCTRAAIRLIQLATLAVIGFAVAVLVILPRATHGVALTVLTGSMTPKIPVGSVVVDRPVDPGTLHVGEVATYQKSAGKAEFITHRIVGINTKTTPTTFVFKGDANRGADLDPVPATAIRGKVWFHVPYLGTVRDAVQSRGMRSTLLVLLIAVLAAYAAAQLLSLFRDRRRGGFSSPDLATGGELAVTAQITLSTLGAASPAEAATLLRARVVRQIGTTFHVSVSVSAVDVDDVVAQLLSLGGKQVAVTVVAPTTGLERLRSRAVAASHA